MTRPPKRNHLLHLLELNPAKAYLEQYINRVEHNPMTADDKRAELEREGYEIANIIDGIRHEVTVTAPNGWEYSKRTATRYAMDRLEQDVLKIAYDHLQVQRNLEALEAENTVLRAFVLDVEYTGARPHLTQQARDLVERYGITADESDDHE